MDYENKDKLENLLNYIAGKTMKIIEGEELSFIYERLRKNSEPILKKLQLAKQKSYVEAQFHLLD